MTKEEATKWLKTFKGRTGMAELSQAFDVAIKALEQEPCGDCISREKAKQFLYERLDRLNDDELYDIFSVIIDDMYNELPSVEQESKTGHWEQYGYSWEDKFKCSECGKEQPKILCGERIIGHWSDYCPNCGVKMVEPQENEDRNES